MNIHTSLSYFCWALELKYFNNNYIGFKKIKVFSLSTRKKRSLKLMAELYV